MIDTSKIIQALCFLLNEISDHQADKIKLVKLLFLADKCHLIRYGRTISGDDFWAMPLGLVGSVTKDILDFDDEEENCFQNPEHEYAKKMLKKVGKHTFKANESCTTTNINKLSETDIEALQLVAEHFGKFDKWSLVKFTHRYPEWKQYEKLFDSKEIKREKLSTEVLISALPDDPFGMSDEHMEESRNILSGLSF